MSKQASGLWAAAAFSLVAALGVACGGDHVPETHGNPRRPWKQETDDSGWTVTEPSPYP